MGARYTTARVSHFSASFRTQLELNATVIARQGGSAVERRAKVLEWTGELDTLSKTVQVLVEIDDPLSQKTENSERPPLLLGSLVQVDFQGPSQSNILEIPRAGIREGSQVFAIDSEDRLIIRDAALAWKSRDAFYVRDNSNELRRIIVGKVQLAVEGAKLNPIKEGQEPPKVGRKGKESTKAEAQKHHGMPTVLRLRLDQGPKRQEIKNHPHKALSKSTSKRS